MSNRLYGVAAITSHPADKVTMIKPFGTWARSPARVRDNTLKKIKERFPTIEGWSDHQVFVERIDQKLVDRFRVEQRWYDKTGARSLYLAVLGAVKEKDGEKESDIMLTSFLSQCSAMAEDKARALGNERFPKSLGWEVVAFKLISLKL